MEAKKVLFIFQEITPYLPESELSLVGRNLPQGIQEAGKEIRTFMPRYGCINERRNQLHEVIRLSGMNLIIDDTDHPLIIKVASIQTVRLQVYFIDNEDFFQRKAVVADNQGKEFEDNDERAIFFARGVLETVKKLRWSPDIIHCHGWMTSLVPLFVKKAYNEDPFFQHSKLVYSIYDNPFNNNFRDLFKDKIIMNGITAKDLSLVDTPNFVNVNKLAVRYSDAVIQGSENLDKDIKEFIDSEQKPFLDYKNPDSYIAAYNDFYDEILS